MSSVAAVEKTGFSLPGQTSFHQGSVRDIYTIHDKYLVMVVTDRISAFDKILPVTVPYKGQVLAEIASYYLKNTRDIVPNWFINSPDPNVVIGYKCSPYKIEVVVRGYLVGHAWREYQAGKRNLCGVRLPEGMKENQKFAKPIITPATHAEVGHDEDISKEEIISQGLIPAADWEKIENYALQLFARGQEMAAKRGLILVDTKYEFGTKDGQLYLIDEVHTPDSSRYFYADTYQRAFADGKSQHQLSKEFVREWLIEHGFKGLDNQKVPELSSSFVEQISNRYIELYEQLIGKKFKPAASDDVLARIENNINSALKEIQDV